MAKRSPKSDFTFVIVAALALSAVMIWLFSPKRGGGVGAPAGTPAPPITAAGWVNGDAPTPEELDGQVVVVEAWATWCGPCRAKAPYMVETYKKFRDQGVIFIGLTGEDAGALPHIEEFLSSTGITWPNGYGAWSTLNALGAEYIPAVWVIGRDGVIAWNSDEGGSLDQAIADALKAG